MTGATGFAAETDADGIVQVVFDLPGSKVNLLSPDVLRALSALMDELEAREDVRGIVFRSAKPGVFLAGMDVASLAAVPDAYEAAEGSRLGQSVMAKIFESRLPSVSAVSGACLGGGTELALACRHRVASDDPRTRIGLPEVRLGIIPGFGGTQRLPRLVGLVTALDLILTGREVDAATAERIGLVDRVVPGPRLLREAIAFLRGAEAPRRGGWRICNLAVERVAPLRRRVLEQARRRLAASFEATDYPAPFLAVRAVEAAFTLPALQGFDLESRFVGELLPTRTSRNLVWLFRSRSDLKRDPAGWEANPRKVRKLAVLGAGNVGAGIAHLAADREVPVRLVDRDLGALLRGLRDASREWNRAVRSGAISRREAARRLEFVSPSVSDAGLSRADLVIETVEEDLDAKQQALAAAENRIADRAVFASSAASLPITEIAARAVHPERVVGLRFFSPVPRVPLVEVVAGQRTSPEAVATVRAFAIELGKVPVVVRDSPGFLVDRILMSYLAEAVRLLGEGVRIGRADASMRAFGMPSGPFESADRAGHDGGRRSAAVIEGAFGRRVGGVAALLDAMVSAGHPGASDGRGFYRYREPRAPVENRAVYRLVGKPEPRELPVETLQERLVLSMVNEAAVCLEDGVVREPRDLDVAVVLGMGFPPCRGGLLRYADAAGIPVLVDRLSRLADAHGERFRPAGLLREMARDGRAFYPEG